MSWGDSDDQDEPWTDFSINVVAFHLSHREGMISRVGLMWNGAGGGFRYVQDVLVSNELVPSHVDIGSDYANETESKKRCG